MQLPWTQACSGSLLLLLVSTLTLLESEASEPQIQVSTKDLYDRLIIESHVSHVLAARIYTDFSIPFMETSWLKDRVPISCHTASIPTPSSREAVHNTTTEEILNVTISTMHAWKDAMEDLIAAVAALEKAPLGVVSRVRGVEESIEIVLGGVKAILSKEYPGAEEGVYPPWTGWADLKSPNEETRHFAIFNMLRCLSRDTHRVDTYLKVLRCREVYNNQC